MSVVASEADRKGTAAGRMAWSSGGEKPPWSAGSEKAPMTAESFEKNEERTGKGCWANFSGCVGGMWATRQMGRNDDREVYVRTTLRELVVYLIFLAILCVLTFGMTSSTMYYYTKVLNDLFLETPYPDTMNNFRGSTQVMDFWRFLEMVLLDALYWEYWYDPMKTPTDEEDRNILYENRMLGVPRMRQIRVRDDSCEVPADFERVIRECYDVYAETHEDKEPFGPLKDTNKTGSDEEIRANETAWVYFTEDQLDGQSYWGKLNTYSGAGSYIDFATTKNETRYMLSELRENLWINRGTRVVFIDFTVYNANINLFCVIKLVIEFPATGGIIPSWSFKTVKLLRYVTPFDYFVLACELIFLFFIAYYIVEEVLEIINLKLQYFNSLWNILDLVVVALCLVCIGFNIFCVMTIGDKLEELLSSPEEFADFEFLGFWQIQFNSAVAVCVFFAWFKLFKYISFNKTMTQLFSTLSRCAKDILGFAIMFFIVFFAFAQLGYLLFGTQVEDFSSFISAIFTLLRTILGDFNFHEIEEANRVLGPIFFLSYVFFVFFVLLNMFLAIINDTYSEVKEEIANQRNEFEIADYFKRGYNNMMGKLGRRDKLIDIENALKLSDTNGDGMMSFEEVRTNLKKCNFSDMEIEMFFARYDVDGSRLLETEEVSRMLKDLEGQRNELESQVKLKQHSPRRPESAKSKSEEDRPESASSRVVVQGGVSQDEFIVLTRRVDHMEQSIGSIVNKIDVVLHKLDTMEKTKHNRKEKMGKMLDDIIEDKDVTTQERRRRFEELIKETLGGGSGCVFGDESEPEI